MKINQRIEDQRITVRDRAPVARGLRRRFNNAMKDAWEQTGDYFHDELVAARFTPQHAQQAGYHARKGQNLPVGSKGFRRSYYGRKFYDPNRGGGSNQALPLVNTGETKRAILSGRPNVRATRYGVRVAYSAARVFNLRHPKSRIRMNDEFRRIAPYEIPKIAEKYDQFLDDRLNNGAQ